MIRSKFVKTITLVVFLVTAYTHVTFADNVDTSVPIFIIGDSTVANYNKKDKRRGWGQVIGSLLKNGNRVVNKARSGASSKSFKPIINKYASPCFWGDGKTKSKWGKIGVKAEIAKADTSKGGYLFIQFGHNDSFNGNYRKGKSTVPGIGNEFDQELMEYINFAKAHNVTPVLVTPMARMYVTLLNDSYFHRIAKLKGVPKKWASMEGKVGDWPQTIRDIGKREHVIVLDLTTKSKDFFATFKNDKEILKQYSWNNADHTHFNKAGALKMAEFIRELAKEVSPNDLYKQFKPIKK